MVVSFIMIITELCTQTSSVLWCWLIMLRYYHHAEYTMEGNVNSNCQSMKTFHLFYCVSVSAVGVFPSVTLRSQKHKA